MNISVSVICYLCVYIGLGDAALATIRVLTMILLLTPECCSADRTERAVAGGLRVLAYRLQPSGPAGVSSNMFPPCRGGGGRKEGRTKCVELPTQGEAANSPFVGHCTLLARSCWLLVVLCGID